jgi:hypothetical protein
MSTLVTSSLSEPEVPARRRALTGILDHAVASLELTDEQRQSVEKTYHEVGAHLAKALNHAPEKGDIFSQGSYRLGTVIRPWRDVTDVFDLDVVFRLVHPAAGQDPKKYRDAVGTHLREKYNGTVKPLAKGWRLDFSKERDYYLDIIPAMDAANIGIIAITDNTQWRPSNPRGYADWFERAAKIMPIVAPLVIANSARLNASNASIEPLPEHTEFKLPLQRFTQISKRHRDYFFNKKTNAPKRAPASIVLTTLLTLSYQRHVPGRMFDSGYDVLLECVKGMSEFIDRKEIRPGVIEYTVKNPSLETENLVARWNAEPDLAKAFYEWHRDYVNVLELLPADRTPQRSLLETTLGKGPVDVAYKKQVDALRAAKESRTLHVSPTHGLNVMAAGVAVPNRRIDGLR